MCLFYVTDMNHLVCRCMILHEIFSYIRVSNMGPPVRYEYGPGPMFHYATKFEFEQPIPTVTNNHDDDARRVFSVVYFLRTNSGSSRSNADKT